MRLANGEVAGDLPAVEGEQDATIRQELESCHSQLLEKGDVAAALKLHETKQWQEAFPVSAGAIDSDYFRLLAGQIDQMADDAHKFIAQSPFAFAKYLVGLRRSNERTYSHLAHIARSIVDLISFDEADTKIALNLSIEKYKRYGVDISRQDLIGFFNRNQAYVCRFFQTAMSGNLPIFHDFASDLVLNPDGFEGFADRGLFRFLTLAYVFLDHEQFEAMLHQLRHIPSSDGQRRHPGPAVNRVIRAFLDGDDGQIAVPAVAKARDRKLNIAVCVSGQLRGFGEAFKTWKHLGLDGHSVRYYVHTWEDIGWRFPDPVSGNGVFRVFRDRRFVEAYRRAGFLFGKEKLTKAYPNLFAAVTVSADAKADDIKAVYGQDAKVVIEDHQRPEFADDPQHQLKMFYKIRETHRLMQEDGQDFDLVIRIRPDRAFRGPRDGEAAPDWMAIWQRCMDKRTLFFGHLIVADTIHAGDQFAVGSPEAMQAYARTLDIQEQASAEKRFEMPRRLRPHVSLGHALFLQGIRREPLEGIYPIDPVPAARLGQKEIRAMLKLDMPDGPQSEMDNLLWHSLSI